ncbi:MAG: hypothetical protein Q4B54_00915 [Coriobacteriales bacterium]|nr:hypothetical protein [Coriobacteriales bacterium]
MARKKAPTARERYDAWLAAHPTGACVIVGASVAVALVGLFAFVTFSGFGGSAEFIYNQF